MLIGVSSLHPQARESVERLGKASRRAGSRVRAAVDLIGTGSAGQMRPSSRRAFGERVAGRIARASYDTLVLVGGDGAAAALDRVGAEAIRVHAALAPGIPIGTILGGSGHGMRIVTKSGAFGDSGSLLRIVDRLQSDPSIRKEDS